METEKTTERTMKAGEVAELLQVTRACVYRWARSGKLPSLRVGGALRFERGAVLVTAKYAGRRASSRGWRADGRGDFVAEVEARRTEGNPEFPAMVEKARRRRRRK